MKTILTTLTLILTTLCAIGQSSTVNWSAGPNQRDVRLVTGQPVMVGTAEIGFFAGEEWHQYGITDIREIFGEPGRFAGTASSNDPIFEGQQIFLRINAGFTGGLYTSTQGWIFPEADAIPPNNTLSINTSQIDRALYGFYNDDHLILVPEAPIFHFAIVGGVLALGLLIIRRPNAR